MATSRASRDSKSESSNAAAGTPGGLGALEGSCVTAAGRDRADGEPGVEDGLEVRAFSGDEDADHGYLSALPLRTAASVDTLAQNWHTSVPGTGTCPNRDSGVIRCVDDRFRMTPRLPIRLSAGQHGEEADAEVEHTAQLVLRHVARRARGRPVGAPTTSQSISARSPSGRTRSRLPRMPPPVTCANA